MADLDIQTSNRPAGFKPPVRSTKDAAADAPDQMVEILIPKTKDQTRDVYVNAAFKPYLIKRGVPVKVPQAVVNVLQNARQLQYTEEVDPVTGRKSLVAEETVSYPFQIL